MAIAKHTERVNSSRMTKPTCKMNKKRHIPQCCYRVSTWLWATCKTCMCVCTWGYSCMDACVQRQIRSLHAKNWRDIARCTHRPACTRACTPTGQCNHKWQYVNGPKRRRCVKADVYVSSLPACLLGAAASRTMGMLPKSTK